MENIPRREWNFAAVMAALVILSVNIVGGYAMFSGKLSWDQYGSVVGSINGIVLGWVGRVLNSGSQQ